jgi:hypothetical protein
VAMIVSRGSVAICGASVLRTASDRWQTSQGRAIGATRKLLPAIWNVATYGKLFVPQLPAMPSAPVANQRLTDPTVANATANGVRAFEVDTSLSRT